MYYQGNVLLLSSEYLPTIPTNYFLRKEPQSSPTSFWQNSGMTG